MGIDHIFIDECHMFKNLIFQTRHTRVAGIGNWDNLGLDTPMLENLDKAKMLIATDVARKRMIEDMNNGDVRVLFGSTSMLGTGVNAQRRAVAVHHLDIPWRPADLEQRNGRAVRKGNTVKLWGGNKVDVIIYGTEKTLDAYKFNLLKNKQIRPVYPHRIVCRHSCRFAF